MRDVKKGVCLECLALKTCQLICISTRKFRLMPDTVLRNSELLIRLSTVEHTGDHRQEDLSKSLSYKQTGLRLVLDFLIESIIKLFSNPYSAKISSVI